MNESPDIHPPPLPPSLAHKLAEYRRRLWSSKTLEVVAAALFGLVVSFLLVFALDRLIETPGWLRACLLVLGVAVGVLGIPLQVFRWVVRHASLDSVAKRIAREDLVTGDRILGVMALTSDPVEFRRSPSLACAAIEKGEEALRDQDLSHTLPSSRHRGWAAAALGVVGVAVAGFVIVPAAAKNALARWLKPTAEIERYTFCQLEAHDDEVVVARFEPGSWELRLAEGTRRRPERGTVSLDDGRVLEAQRVDDRYTFSLPELGFEVEGKLVVGDVRESIAIRPVDRPEVTSARAEVRLPDYLELPEPVEKDVRGGVVNVVTGSRVSISAELTRELEHVRWTAGEAEIDGSTIHTEPTLVTDSQETSLEWRDVHGLQGKSPFGVGMRARDDAPPTVIVEGLRNDSILLYDKATEFTVRAGDDFGAREVGLEWSGHGELERGFERAEGERVLGRGEPDASQLTLAASLHPRLHGIDPQRLTLRAYVLDSLPGRERMVSAPYEVVIMTQEQHMIWVTGEFANWFDEAVEVRDQENLLLKENERLFGLGAEALATPASQRQIQAQAAAERVNSRRLNRLVGQGQGLLSEAARNEEINASTLDEWAEMMSILERIATEKMPSVADLLSAAAEASPNKPPHVAGVDRSPETGNPPTGGAKVELPNAPQVVDTESSFMDPDTAEPEADAEASKASPATLGLASTNLQGGPPQEPGPEDDEEGDDEEAPSPTEEELAKALAEQKALMEEFEKVAGKITEILANLEGSTFVKRLKSLSRAETGVASDLDGTLVAAFGSDEIPSGVEPVAAAVDSAQRVAGKRASSVREDLAAYVERMTSQGRPASRFQTVHDEMGEVGVTREITVIQSLAKLSRVGEAIAGAENLADELDRWAEMLVGPG